MPDQLLQKVQAGYAAWNHGDLDQTLAVLAPDVEWHTSASFPGTEALYTGHEGFKLFWAHLHEPFENVHAEIESYEREDELAILHVRFHGTSRTSGVEVDLPWVQALVIEDELIKRSALDRSTGAALEALGISDGRSEF